MCSCYYVHRQLENLTMVSAAVQRQRMLQSSTTQSCGSGNSSSSIRGAGQSRCSRKLLMASGRGREGMCPRRGFPMALRTASRHRCVSLRGHPGGGGRGRMAVHFWLYNKQELLAWSTKNNRFHKALGQFILLHPYLLGSCLVPYNSYISKHMCV